MSKIERGFESDLEDIVFLIHQNQIEYDHLLELAETMLARATEFHLDSKQIRAHLAALAQMK